MLAARDQENRVFGHSVGGVGGKAHALGPKTPMKVPLNDGCGTVRLAGGGGGKSILGGRPGGGNENLRTVGKGKGNMVTPLEPRTARAPLGNKTTNAKAHSVLPAQHHQTQKGRGGVKEIVREIEQSQKPQQAAVPATGRRAKVASPRVNASKLSVLSDETAAATSLGRKAEADDIEYAAPRDPVRPYVSDVCPDGVLTFAAFAPQNRLRGYYDHYYNPVDDDGVPLRDKALAEQQQRAFEKLDLRVQEDLDAFDWSIGDVPASRTGVFGARSQPKPKQQTVTVAPAPATLVSRKAASSLALGSKISRPTKPASVAAATKPPTMVTSLLPSLPLRKARPPSAVPPLEPKTVRRPLAESASRTTLGYNKGRTALTLVRGGAACAPTPTSASASERVSTLAATRSHHVGPAYDTKSGPGMPATPKQRAPALQLREQEPLAERSPAFLSIFEAEDEQDEQDNLGGADTLVNDDLDDGFQMDVEF